MNFVFRYLRRREVNLWALQANSAFFSTGKSLVRGGAAKGSQNEPEVIDSQAEQPKIKKEKYKLTRGPQLYISTVLNKKGPMTIDELWQNYVFEKPRLKEHPFRSKTYMKTVVVASMLRSGKIIPAGYNKKEGFYGFKLVPEIAFKNVDPSVLEKIEPRPDIKYFREKAQKEEGSQAKEALREISI
eukprot:TRINITY_DN3130_c0_g1_i1.p1 TRINITY_DN3130_c0_g1~~TRINITY_DN3130_c0_g1_i1.p1  ORF type:complete len:186 (+),score=58.64 TRINITY_DN3130_c0_g1_i1:113-670(+)